jgi:hypothetical protein
MPTIELPDGHTADLRDVGDLRRGDVRFALKAADDEGINLFGAGMGLSGIGTLQDALIVRFVRRWSLTGDDGQPLEVSLASVQDLPVKYHKPLAAVVTPALAEILGGGETNGQAPSPLPAGPSSTSASTG